jgi:hypothetical protein
MELRSFLPISLSEYLKTSRTAWLLKMSENSTEHEVVIDSIQRIILIEDEFSVEGNGSNLVYNPVPKGINIFALLNLKQPEEVSNLSNWNVVLSSENPLYPNLQQVFEVCFSLKKNRTRAGERNNRVVVTAICHAKPRRKRHCMLIVECKSNFQKNHKMCFNFFSPLKMLSGIQKCPTMCTTYYWVYTYQS